MSLTKGFILTAVLASTLAAGASFSAPTRLSDVQYLQANRCLGLMESKNLGAPDNAALRAFVKDQSYGRVGFVVDRGDQTREDATSQGNRAHGERHDSLIAERDRVCQAVMPSTNTAAMPGAQTRQ